MRIAIAAAVACLSIIGITANAQVHAAIRQHTEIPPEPLDLALRTLAKDRGFQVVYLTEDVRALQTRGAIGDFTVDEALKKLLNDSRLDYKFVDDNTVSVFLKTDPISALEDKNRGSASVKSEESSGSPPKNSAETQFRLAQVDQTPAGPQVEQGKKEDTKKKVDLEEIVVTGTHIHGEANSISPVMKFDRDAIERSGYLNTEDFIQSIPQAFAGGAYGASPEGSIGNGVTAGFNSEHASAVNLRGLGENATLVLLDGHRMAPSALGNIVDISTIPLAAIDHIDILTDGASAIYGADAVAGVVNIVLRKNFTGAETQGTYGGAAGDYRTGILTQTFGTQWATGSIMGAYQYEHDTSLPTTARPFTSGAPQPTNLLNPLTKNSLIINGEQSLGSALKLYGDSLLTWERTATQIAYTQTDQSYTYSNPNAINVNLGLRYVFADKWVADFSGTYARQQTDEGNYYNDIGALNNSSLGTYTAHTPEVDLTISGSPLGLPGGDVGVAIGASRRDEKGDAETPYPNSQLIGIAPSIVVDRHVTAEYAELSLPFVSDTNEIPLVRRLSVSAAIRHDDYSDFGGTTNPKLGMLWSPTPIVDFKANWSRAFRPPSLGELYEDTPAIRQPFALIYPFANPSGSGVVPVIVNGAANPHLGPETATTYDVSIELRPILGLTLSLDYYNVDFKGRIENTTLDPNALLHPGEYASMLTNLPNDAAAAAYYANLLAQNYTVFSIPPYFMNTAGVRYVYPISTINAAVVRQNGVDFTGRYDFAVGADNFRVNANAAFINHIDTQFTPGAAVVNVVNAFGNPLRWRFRVDGTWTRGPFELTTAANFSNAYSNPYSDPPAPIGSFLTFDVSGALQLARDDSSSFFHGTAIRLSVTNLLNRYPPYASLQGVAVAGQGVGLAGVNYDVGNASPLGRVISLQLRKKW